MANQPRYYRVIPMLVCKPSWRRGSAEKRRALWTSLQKPLDAARDAGLRFVEKDQSLVVLWTVGSWMSMLNRRRAFHFVRENLWWRGRVQWLRFPGTFCLSSNENTRIPFFLFFEIRNRQFSKRNNILYRGANRQRILLFNIQLLRSTIDT